MLPTPITAKAMSAVASIGEAAISRNGEPSTPPTPTAASSQPTPAEPVPSSLIAVTTSSTARAPATSICAVNRPRSALRPIVRAPASSAPPSDSSACSGCSRSTATSGSRRTSRIVESPNAAAAKPNTAVVPVATSSTPASAGPAKKPRPSIVEETTFAAVSCSGSSTRLGRIATCAGRKGVPATATPTPSP